MAALTEHLLDQLRRRLPGLADLRPLAGGASSLTYTGVSAQGAVVVKVAPPGVAPVLHRDVLRQARIIRALGPTPVPVPVVLAEDAGEPPEIPPLFVMSKSDGVSSEPLFDAEAHSEPIGVVAQRFRHAAMTLAQLHRLAPESSRLTDEPAAGPETEVDRWSNALDTVGAEMVPGWRAVGDALRSTVPSALPAAIVHGDFRLGNLLAVGERITAVIDWEIWSIGDPRVDVGWFLINSDPQTYQRPTPYVGATPPPAELAAIYTGALGREAPDLAWFCALACFKSAATWSLIVKHNRRRTAPDAGVEAMAAVLPALLGRALTLLD